MKPFDDGPEREQLLTVAAATIVFGMVSSGRLNPTDPDVDAMIDSAFSMAELFLAKVEKRFGVKGKA